MSVSIGSQSADIAQGVTDAYEFREGEGTVDDVSLFQLRDFLAKIEAERAAQT